MGGTTCTFNINLLDARACNPVTTVVTTNVIPPLTVNLTAVITHHGFSGTRRRNNGTTLMLKLYFVSRNTVPFTTHSPVHILPYYVINKTLANTVSVTVNTGLVTPRNNLFILLVPNTVAPMLNCLMTVVTNALITNLTCTFLGHPRISTMTGTTWWGIYCETRVCYPMSLSRHGRGSQFIGMVL